MPKGVTPIEKKLGLRLEAPVANNIWEEEKKRYAIEKGHGENWRGSNEIVRKMKDTY